MIYRNVAYCSGKSTKKRGRVREKSYFIITFVL